MDNLEEEIFGADSDEDNQQKQPRESNFAGTQEEPGELFQDEADDLFYDSDDDRRKDKGGKLLKGGKTIKKKTYTEDNLMDSDEEEFSKRDNKLKKKSKAHKRKREESERRDRKEKISRLQDKKNSEVSKNEGSSGDEYDSGEEVVETQADRDFIDEDDDLGDVRHEYDQDGQDFDDERPEKSFKKKSSSSAHKSTSGSSYIPKTKELDPLSQTLNEIRKPKIKPLSDAEKDMMIDKLLKQMARAVVLDDECFRNKQPAIYKMQLLPAVQKAVAMKALHNTLLEKDFLCYLRDWIEPKNSTTLPALTLRTSVYEMLLKLPCLTEHLKRGNDKVPIGYVIVSLRKHKMETPENKRLLKEIMDKWSRPIFTRASDSGAGEGIAFLPADNEEVRTAILRKYSEPQQQQQIPTTQSQSIFAAGNATQEKKEADYYQRARAPSSHGYLFTVQPELKSIDKRNIMEKALGEDRMKLFKKTMEGGKSSATGKKTNTRAMNISVSGGNLKH